MNRPWLLLVVSIMAAGCEKAPPRDPSAGLAVARTIETRTERTGWLILTGEDGMLSLQGADLCG